MRGSPDFEWEIGAALLAAVDQDGFTATQWDAFGEQEARVAGAETHHPYGFTGRAFAAPIDANGNPDPSMANQILVMTEGGKSHAWVMEAPQVVQLLPTIPDGETMFYGPVGQFLRQTLDGHLLGWAPAGEDGEVEPGLLFGADGFEVSGRWGSLKLNDTGLHVTTSSGATFDMGASGGLPGPLSSVGSYVKFAAGSFKADAAAVALGAKGLGNTPMVNGIWLLSELAVIKAALTVIAAALQAGGVGTGTITLPGAPAAVAAVAAILPPTPANLFVNASATF